MAGESNRQAVARRAARSPMRNGPFAGSVLVSVLSRRLAASAHCTDPGPGPQLHRPIDLIGPLIAATELALFHAASARIERPRATLRQAREAQR